MGAAVHSIRVDGTGHHKPAYERQNVTPDPPHVHAVLHHHKMLRLNQDASFANIAIDLAL
jgi:hypothetical protein